ncbi:MAG: hypothetical protein J2P19_24250 [Pseudonocardia sp.]|nr:hypothetical protein [Pseudonocardia sp.]
MLGGPTAVDAMPETEVSVMAQLDRAVRTTRERAHAGLGTLERKALEVGQIAERRLGEQGIAPGQLTDTITANVGAARHGLARDTRRSRKRLAKNARRTRKELLRAAKGATHEARHAARVARQTGQKTASDIAAELEQRAARARKDAARRDAAGRRRPWPWILVGIAAAAAVAVGVYVARSRAAASDWPLEESDSGSSPTTADTSDNGQASTPAEPSTRQSGREPSGQG